ncbi:hypothetical protein RI129_009854 [Pyrocoelia pectoralis]|uniref:C2 domain-containing protein n=1 Tax=Pyrocoelia pectoralis TaxID=417401 RepID=A0AAN7V5I2_9COLE
MEYQFLKRKLVPIWYQHRDPWEDLIKIKVSTSSDENTDPPPTWETAPDTIVSRQNSDFIQGKDTIYSLVVVSIGVLVILIVIAIIAIRKRRNKIKDEEQGSSILVYPSQQGSSIPQLLTKDIDFSLPPLRSTSLGDLNEPERDDDSDYDTDTLLLPSNHNQRSHSFSCYGLGVIEPALYKSTLNLDELQWPEGHIGRIWFSLRYEPSTEKLLVSLLKAKNLPSRSIGTVNSCDPFVRLHLMPDERRFLQSKQKKKTCNPYFDETLVFQVSAKDMTDHTLKLTVIDAGRTKRKSEIGHVTFQLKDLEIGDGTEQQLFKFDLEKEIHEQKSDLGEVLVSLVYNEHLNRLTATVIEARRLKFQGDKHEAYVRVTLSQHYRAVKEKRTCVSKPSIDGNHSFAEGFNFKLMPSHADITSLAFHVFQHTSGYGRDKLIGKCVLGSYMFARGRALTHWNTAIANPMEPLQQWHTLSE